MHDLKAVLSGSFHTGILEDHGTIECHVAEINCPTTALLYFTQYFHTSYKAEIIVGTSVGKEKYSLFLLAWCINVK